MYQKTIELRRFLAVLTLVASASLAKSQSVDSMAITPVVPAFDNSKYAESFDQVWSTIRDVHWDPAVSGDKWSEAKVRLRPKIAAATSEAEAREVLQSLLAELGQSHCGIIPSQVYASIEQQSNLGGPGYSGITTRWIDDAFIVTHVAIGSPAEKERVQAGWRVTAMCSSSNRTVTAHELIEETAKSSEHAVVRLDTSRGLVGSLMTTGAVGDKLTISFIDSTNEKIVKEIQLVTGLGQPAKLGHLPTTYVDFQSRSVADEIGYLKFNAFLDAPRLMSEFQKVITSEEAKQGLVIDLRGNIGGLVLLTIGMSSWFVEEPVTLGTMIMKSASMEMKLNPRVPRYTAPVAVLIDECSISAAEIMAAALQDSNVAKVFGSRSAGLVLPSNVTRLPSGDGFQYAMSDYRSASGRVLEGKGVVPDFTIELHSSSFMHGGDPVLDAAVLWLKEHASL